MDLDEKRKRILENNKRYVEIKEAKRQEKINQYYKNNKWRFQRYYQNHKECLIDYQKQYYQNHRETILEKQRLKSLS